MFSFRRHRIAPLVGAAVALLISGSSSPQAARAAEVLIVGQFYAPQTPNQVELALQLHGEIDGTGIVLADGVVAFAGREGADQAVAFGGFIDVGTLRLQLFRNEIEPQGFALLWILPTGEASVTVQRIPGGPIEALTGVAMVDIRKDRDGVIESK
jgi:hypothetical protein